MFQIYEIFRDIKPLYGKGKFSGWSHNVAVRFEDIPERNKFIKPNANSM